MVIYITKKKTKKKQQNNLSGTNFPTSVTDTRKTLYYQDSSLDEPGPIKFSLEYETKHL